MKGKPTVALDFDGVIHSYTSGYQGAENIVDPPVEGMKEVIAELRHKYKIVVVSSRSLHKGGKAAIQQWLQEHDIEVDDITGEKVPAIVYVDDRAMTFDGDAASLKAKIQSFKPWNKK
ncbi:hypothetical protein [Tuberibacillus sp. Marseille-P3662]|uniref:hypothetical protein n=1 Tax=Tuberibacillus sp. Marseille-P3662 TaxID=1965358 RepID=UPI000A1C9FC4|nr:hypothetical protein [Tuberibacillus sp. Marseille-P3662]